MISVFASERHYAQKLVPIWNALPTEIQGEFFVHPRIDGYVNGATVMERPSPDGILMVASQKDAGYAKGKFIYVEHGAGQTYQASQFYSNIHRPNMLAALVPGPYCAEQTMKANPGVAVIPIGAPHLATIERHSKRVPVFAWHWRCGVQLEADTAFDEYAHIVADIAKKQEVLGTGHPRIIGELTPWYHASGIEVISTPESALEHASVLIADNTSLIYEAAALDIPVILLNKTTYRKFKNWGLRFWDIIPGTQVDDPADLEGFLQVTLDGDGDEWREIRRRCTAQVYGPDPLTSLSLAVKELIEVVKGYNNAPRFG